MKKQTAGGQGRKSIKGAGTGGGSVVISAAPDTAPELLKLEGTPPTLKPEQVFRGRNAVEMGANMVIAAIKEYGLCSFEFYSEWGKLAGSLAGATNTSRATASAALALLSPETHAGQNLIGSVLKLVQRYEGRIKPETDEDLLNAVKQLVEEYQGKSLTAVIGRIKAGEEDALDKYLSLIDELEDNLPAQVAEILQTKYGKDISQASFDEKKAALLDYLRNFNIPSFQRGNKHIPTLSDTQVRGDTKKKTGVGGAEDTRAKLLKTAEDALSNLPLLFSKMWNSGITHQMPQNVANFLDSLITGDRDSLGFFTLYLMKGDVMAGLTKNAKVATFFRNIFFEGEDLLPTMDTRMMQGFGLFHGVEPAVRDAIQETLFRDAEIYAVWTGESAEFFDAVNNMVKTHAGISLSRPATQAAMWQIIRAFVDTNTVRINPTDEAGVFVIPNNFGYLFPKTTAAIIEKLRKAKQSEVAQMKHQDFPAYAEKSKAVLGVKYREEALTKAVGGVYTTVDKKVIRSRLDESLKDILRKVSASDLTDADKKQLIAEAKETLRTNIASDLKQLLIAEGKEIPSKFNPLTSTIDAAIDGWIKEVENRLPQLLDLAVVSETPTHQAEKALRTVYSKEAIATLEQIVKFSEDIYGKDWTGWETLKAKFDAYAQKPYTERLVDESFGEGQESLLTLPKKEVVQETALTQENKRRIKEITKREELNETPVDRILKHLFGRTK